MEQRIMELLRDKNVSGKVIRGISGGHCFSDTINFLFENGVSLGVDPSKKSWEFEINSVRVDAFQEQRNEFMIVFSERVRTDFTISINRGFVIKQDNELAMLTFSMDTSEIAEIFLKEIGIWDRLIEKISQMCNW
jgi:hypothetical protein